MADDVCALERRLLDPEVRADPAGLDALLRPDLTEFGASGRMWTRAEIVAALVGQRVSQLLHGGGQQAELVAFGNA